MSASDVNNVAEQLAKTSVDSKSELSFAGKGFKLDKEEDAQEIVDALNKSDAVHILRLEGNTLGIDAAKAISKALEKHPEFERAQWSDMFTGRLKSEIPQALRYLGNGIMLAKAHLVELDLSDNAFGPNGMQGLTEFLKSESCYSLKELRLNNNGLGVTGGKMLAKSLLECHKLSSAAGKPLALRVFVSGRGRLENEGSTALAEAFKAMGSLEEVSMPQNGINHPGITALSDALAANPKLRCLNLNDNTFTEKGAKAMAKALPNMQKLEKINFGDCLLRTGGAQVIAAAIRDNHTSVKELVLSFNEIKKPGANAIAEAMENKINLIKLELDGNQLGEDGVELVRGTMEALDKLDQLGSMSDDEGLDSEDEEDGDQDEDEENPEEDEEGDEIQDPDFKVTGIGLTPRSEAKPVNAADFLAFPSPTKLKNLQGNKAKAILDHLGVDVKDVDKAMQSFVKLTSVVGANDEKTKQAACECADGIFNEVLSSKDENISSLVANSLLVNMGLLKSEDKIRPPSSINGTLIVLEHIVRQSYFPKTTRDVLQIFIARPHPLLDASSGSRHQLLQTMYKF